MKRDLSLVREGVVQFVFGRPGEGKSSHAWETIKDLDKVVWVALDNLNLFRQMSPNIIELYTVLDWETFLDEILRPIRQDVNQPDAVVLDGIDVLLGYALTSAAGGSTPTQANWLTAGLMLRNAVLQLADKVNTVVFTAQVRLSDEGDEQIALNRHSLSLLTPIADSKVFVSTTPVVDEHDNVTGVTYRSQNNAAMAVRLIP